MNFPNVSIVVIGYNEAKNLNKTFKAINCINYPLDKLEVIYVDSGSIDESIEIAKQFTKKIFVEDKYPSPGRNRNRGLIEAKYEVIHFIDGDVTIDPDYLINIVPLFKEKDVQAIVGQLDEQNPNIYNRIASLSNEIKKEGFTIATSTGATYLRKALLYVNGYDERIKRGQETELGERFRSYGFKIWCTRYKMGSHNFDISSLSSLFKKSFSKGKASMQVFFMKEQGLFFKKKRRTFYKLIIKYFIVFATLIVSLIYNKLLLFLLLYFLLIIFQNRKLILNTSHNIKITSLSLVLRFFLQYVYFFGMITEIFKHFFNRNSQKLYKLEKDLLKWH